MKQDLTAGPITKHLLKTTGFMLVMMFFQTMYFLIDLYWVGRLGTDSVAAVSVSGNLTFIVLALTQMLGVGTTTVVSHAVGRKDHDGALVLFNQSQVLAMVTGVLFLIVGLATRMPYANALSADANTARLAGEFLLWMIPAMALQFGLVAMGSALRGIGNFKTGMIVSSATLVVNMALAPILIFGWGTGHAFGIAGAAIATFISIVVGLIWLVTYFLPRDAYLRFVVEDWKPRPHLWKRILTIGLPTGVEFGITALYLFLVYAIARQFGAAAQAGFGVGSRVVQAGFMPVVALGFAVAPVAGQNFGAMQAHRVKSTFRDAALMAAGVMLLLAILCNVWPHEMVQVFSSDPEVIAVGEDYLRIGSLSFIPSGLLFVTSSMFQAMGNTIPSLVTSAVRIAIVAALLPFLTKLAGFELVWIWYLSLGSVLVQLVLGMLLLRREFQRRLAWPTTSDASSGSV